MCSMRCAKRPRRSSHWKTRAPRPSPPACAWLQRRAPWPAAPRPPARHAAIDSNETITGDSVDTSIKHGLLTLIDRAARLTGQHTAAARLADLQRQLDEVSEDAGPSAVLSAVWLAAGLEGTARTLHDPTPGELPFAIYSPSTGWGLLQSRGSDGAWRGEGVDGRPLELESLAGLSCVGLPRRSEKNS